MYLILLNGQDSMCGRRTEHTYTPIFTDSILDVAHAFRDGKNVKAFRIDSLTEITDIDIEISEKPKELS